MYLTLLALLAMITTASSFALKGGLSSRLGRVNPSLQSLKMSSKATAPYKLVLVRHGESSWNQQNLFTGWYDCPLSEKGHKEAEAAGVLLNKGGYKFDLAYTSMLQRAIRTLWHSLEATGCMYIPIKNAWELNERHYGALQGLDKKATVEKYGTDQVNIWRRSYDVPPPPVDENSPHYPGNDPRYAGSPQAQKIKTESLATTLERVLPFWKNEIAPQIKSGKRVIIAAHGNSLRALVKYLDNIPESEIAELNIPTAVPLVYHLDENLKPIPQADAIAPLTGSYVGDRNDILARIQGVKNQTKK